MILKFKIKSFVICALSFVIYLVFSQGGFEAEAIAQELVAESPAGRNVTLDFKDADIQNVLKIISYKSGVNIVTTPEVMGTVTIRLVNVPWDKALDVILKTYGYGYERVGNIITVAPIDKLTELKKKEVELAEVQPTLTEVFHLKYLDALDAKRAIEPQLSPRGKITALEMTGQAGWEFGTAELAKRKRIAEEKMGRSKTLIVSDIPPVLDKIREVIAQIDVKPHQILIETRLVEVNLDTLKDIGFDWGTGVTGVTDSIGQVSLEEGDRQTIGAHGIGTEDITPSIFGPKASVGAGYISPTSAGLEIIYKKLTSPQFEAILYALEEDVGTNTLSAPSILALDNQEASILIGTKYPILKSEESTQSSYTVSKSLDYYQDIGIQLNVVPQVSSEGYINMIVHPAITSTSDGVGTTTTVYYPIIITREAETRVLMRDGETVVIGGLLKDIKSTSTIGIPVLSKIPFFGALFRRNTVDTAKVDLLIFITAHIIKEGDFSPEDIAELEKRLERSSQEGIIKKKEDL